MDGGTDAFPDALKEQLRAILLQTQPKMMFMYNPQDGWTNHPDHKHVARYLQEELDTLAAGQTPRDRTDRLKIADLLQNKEIYQFIFPQSAERPFRQIFPITHSSWNEVQFQPDTTVNLKTFLPLDIQARKSLSMQRYVTQYPNSEVQKMQRFFATYPYEAFARYKVQSQTAIPTASPDLPAMRGNSLSGFQKTSPMFSPNLPAVEGNTLPGTSHNAFWPPSQPVKPSSFVMNGSASMQTTGLSNRVSTGHPYFAFFANSKQSAKSMDPTRMEAGKPSSAPGKVWRQMILFAPTIGLIGSSALITKSLPTGIKTSLVNTVRRTVGRSSLKPGNIDEGLKEFGQKVVGFDIFMKSLSGVSAALVSGQPSMTWGNLIQIIPSGILAFKRSDVLQNFATSMEILLGGLYTIGFANELKNKDPHTRSNQIRRYDMARLTSLFKLDNPLSLKQRLMSLPQVLADMAVFTMKDHVLLFQDLGRQAQKLGQKAGQLLVRGEHKAEPAKSLTSRLGEWIRILPPLKANYPFCFVIWVHCLSYCSPGKIRTLVKIL